ncbi:MAG TPA: STAS domain-containing protein [Cellulomonas sp.]
MSRAGSITAHDDGAVTTVTLEGEIDAALHEECRQTVACAVAAGLPVELDLGAVRFLDSTGVELLLQHHLACERMGLACTLRHVPDRVCATLALLGLDRFFTIEPGRLLSTVPSAREA